MAGKHNFTKFFISSLPHTKKGKRTREIGLNTM